jgi:hypothetical protein
MVDNMMNQQFRLRAGNQHGGADSKFESAKFLRAEQILEWFTGHSPRDQGFSTGPEIGRDQPVRLTHQLVASQPKRVLQQPHRLLRSITDPGLN